MVFSPEFILPAVSSVATHVPDAICHLPVAESTCTYRMDVLPDGNITGTIQE